VGGTKEPDSWDPSPSAAVREVLLRRMADTEPSLLGAGGHWDVIRDIVGRRPTRKGGIRIEAEAVGEGRTVVHAYGLGGRGYELSWGVAGAAAKLVEETLS
jgi:glycine/D-amino acid oxidase-like deaminating enzyme